jgi:hypothetical protein
MKLMKNGKYLPIACLIAGTFGMQIAFAGFPQKNAVTIDGEPVFSINSTVDGLTPGHRAQIAQDALDNALATSNCSADLVSVRHINGAPVVEFNGHMVVTADKASAVAVRFSSADQLAQSWADSIRQVLSDKERAQSYKNSLIGHNPIQAAVSYVERSMYVPVGTALPVTFDRALSSGNLKVGDQVVASVSQNVPIGKFMVPADSQLFGKVTENQPGQLTVMFTALKTPSGSETPINASLAAPGSIASKPHPVYTLSLPAGTTTYARIPAMVAIGAKNEDSFERLTFAPGSQMIIEPGQRMSIILDDASRVALIERNLAM